MLQTPAPSLTLETFLELPETKPASEFLNGQGLQKPMPQGEHSTLQGRLTATINEIGIAGRLAHTFPELRCTFGGASLVPDISVFHWAHIPRTDSGRIANRFLIPPDWAIEILSPDQSPSKVLANLLHCSQQGTELGWLLYPADESILVVLPESRVQLYEGGEYLPVLAGLPLNLSATMVSRQRSTV